MESAGPTVHGNESSMAEHCHGGYAHELCYIAIPAQRPKKTTLISNQSIEPCWTIF